ncbi:MAG: class I SAM-dependent methyltransferase [Pseudomonadota bacterium]
MRVGFKGESVGERLFLATGMIPELAMVPMISMVVNNAFFAAQRLGIMNLLEEGAHSAEAVAQAVDADPHAVQVLLEALTGFGYLEREDGRFQYSQALRKSFAGRSAEMARSMAAFAPDVARKFESLDQAVTTGEVADFHFNPVNAQQWGHYLTFLKLSADRPTRAIVDNVKLGSTPRRMLDVAGGPAMYSIAFCERYPELETVILDLPESAEEGEKEIAKAGLTDRISYQIGDLVSADWGTGYDIVLLSNMLHCFKEPECCKIIDMAFAALGPEGVLITNEPGFPGEGENIDTFAAFTSLLYFTVTGGRTHPTPEIERWLSDAGFASVTRQHGGRQTQVIGRKGA